MHNFYEFLQIKLELNWTIIISIFTIFISISALFLNRTIARKNSLLAIQQAIFKTVTEKAKDCNTLWEKEPFFEQDNNSPYYTGIGYFAVVSELIISKEVIEKSFYLFGKNSNSIENFRDDYYYLFWKQLRTNLRDFIIKAQALNEFKTNEIFANQIRDLHKIFKKHFEV